MTNRTNMVEGWRCQKSVGLFQGIGPFPYSWDSSDSWLTLFSRVVCGKDPRRRPLRTPAKMADERIPADVIPSQASICSHSEKLAIMRANVPSLATSQVIGVETRASGFR
jgi:hypothetical protein